MPEERSDIPQNLAAEEAVLGSLLIDPEAIHHVVGFLVESDFYLQKHGWIYTAILILHNDSRPLDFLNLNSELERKEQLEAIGGAAYIGQLINSVPSAINVDSYARLVKEMALRRKLLEAATQIAKLAMDVEQPMPQVMEESERAVFNVAQGRTGDYKTMSQAIQEYYNRVEFLYAHQGEPMGVPTGFIDLDKLTGGFQKSDLITIAARPGVGKTSFVMSVAVNAAERGKRVAIFSLEMSTEQIVQRMVAAKSRIDSQRLRIGEVHDDEWPMFAEAIGQLTDLPIFIDDTPAATPMQIRSKCRRIQSEFGLDMVIVDYLQLMASGSEGGRRNENRVQEVSYLSRTLKGLARELDVPILSVSQLSRSPEQRQDKRPILSDLRESGAIEQDSDVVAFIYRDELVNPDTTKPHIAELIIAKHRSGPTGTINLFFNNRLTLFADAVTKPIDYQYDNGGHDDHDSDF